MNEFQQHVIAALADHSPVWMVGGAVRDKLLGIDAHDIDLVVKLDVAAIADILRTKGFSPQQIGMRFQTVSAFQDGSRVDIVPIEDIQKDALRRDFTINAIYEDQKTCEIIDPLAGCTDLTAKVLKACGSAEYRFRDDPVRILRMVKFSVKYSLQIESSTWQEAQELIALLVSVPGERITAELAEILVLDNAEKAVRMLDEIGYWDLFVPELARLKGVVQNQYHSLDVWEHTLSVFKGTPDDLFLRVAGLFHDIGKWEVASKECYLAGILQYYHQNYYIEGFKVIGTRGPKELEYKLKPYLSKPVKILGARLDHYPETVQFKRTLIGEQVNPGIEYVHNGKRHFLNHEKASARLLAQILKRYKFSMFFGGQGQKREQDLLKIVENHMLATLAFMPEFRGESSRKSLKQKAAELVWEVCWNGRDFELQHIHDFVRLWKADFNAGKVHSDDQTKMFEQIMAELISTALWEHENLPNLDWTEFGEYAKEAGIDGPRYGRFKEFLTAKAMQERNLNINRTFINKAEGDFR